MGLDSRTDANSCMAVVVGSMGVSLAIVWKRRHRGVDCLKLSLGFGVRGKRRSSRKLELQFARFQGFCYTARAFGQKVGVENCER